MKHIKKGSTGRFLSILLAAVVALSLLPADMLSPAVYAEETGYDETAGGAGADKSIPAEKDGNAVPAEESGTREDDTEEPETEAGSTDEPESGAGGTEEPDDGEEPGEEPVSTEKEDTAECVCGTLCTADSVNADCPVCGAEGDSIAGCKGEPEDTKKEDIEQEDTENAKNPEPEDTKQEDTEEENTEQEDTQDTGLCGHHPEHTQECGYTESTQDKEGTPCTYACRICPIEDLIAALPDEVTADNAEDVRAQLDEILALYRELTEEEQDQIDLSRCYALQEALDAAGVPVPLEDGEIPEDAVAKVEKSGSTTYVGNLQEAFGMSGMGATTRVTLLRDVALTDCVNVTSGFFSLDLNGHTITGGDTAFSVGSGIFDIQNTGTAAGITASGNAIEVSNGGWNWVTGAPFPVPGAAAAFL